MCAHIQSGTKSTLAQGYTRITQPCFRPSFLTIYIQVWSNEINPSSVIIKGKEDQVSPYLEPVNNIQLFILKWCDLNHTTVFFFVCIFFNNIPTLLNVGSREGKCPPSQAVTMHSVGPGMLASFHSQCVPVASSLRE